MKARWFAAFIAVLVLASAGAAQSSRPVRTQAGLVQGIYEDGMTVYKGVPYAAPPVGDLRWRAPRPPIAWKGVRQADKFAASCMQVPIVNATLGMDPIEVSEDCLYLNIWTPAKSRRDRLAVMVWIYGGGFTQGSTSFGTYDGRNLAKKGVVVVSLGYRLNTFGFLAMPQLSAEQGGHSGNYGLLDQIEGLRWVKRNIAAFGGDSSRVTIFGESAGGTSVSILAASPLAKGLFQRIISESGGLMTPPRYANEGGEMIPALSVAEKNGAVFFSKLGVSSLADARKSSAQDILKSSPQGLGGASPNFDGYVLPGDLYKLYEAGRYNDTPILVGTNADEGSGFVRSATAASYVAQTHAGYGEYADKILAAYPAGSDDETLRSARDLARDTSFAWSTWTWARLQSRTGKSKAFVFRFSHRPNYPDTPQYKSYGASHGGELAFVFGNFTAGMPTRPADQAVSDEMSSYWVNFAKTGDPNGAGLPVWPAFTEANQQLLDINDPSKAIPVPNPDQLKVLDAYYAWRRKEAEAKH